MTQAEKEEQKEFVSAVLHETGLSVDQLASLLGRKVETVKKLKWADIRLTEPNRIQLQKIRQGYTNGRPNFGVGFGGARGRLLEAMHKAGLDSAKLAKGIGYEIGFVQAVLERGVPIKEDMAEKIEALNIGVTAEDLLAGSDSPRTVSTAGIRATVGSKSTIQMLGEGRVRMIPLISMAQAGPSINFEDEIYQHDAVPVVGVKDPQAMAMIVRGNSMEPEIKEGDVAVVCPNWQPRNGDEVVVRTIDGDVMCKIYQAKSGGQQIILSSYNPAFPSMEIPREEIEWVYPVQSIQKTRRRD